MSQIKKLREHTTEMDKAKGAVQKEVLNIVLRFEAELAKYREVGSLLTDFNYFSNKLKNYRELLEKDVNELLHGD